MSNELATYNQTAQIAVATPNGMDYEVNCGGGVITLKRDIDFGVIPGMKKGKPTLYKSGAEKVCMGYGLLQQYELVDCDKEFGKEPFIRYLFRCNLVKIVNGQPYTISCGFGSANTAEKRNGFNSPYDADNGCVKMAMKRALTAAALAISGLSDAFTQDMENEEFMNNGKALIETDKPDSPVNAKQIKRLYAIGGDAGLNAAEVKQKLAVMGYTSTKQILQKDYNSVCDAISKGGQ